MNIFLGIAAGLFVLGMVGGKREDERRNYTIGFVTCVAAIVLMNMN